MPIPLKTICLAVLLTLGLSYCPTTRPQSNEVGTPLILNAELPALSPIKLSDLQPLSLAPFPYAPMGTYANQYPDSSQCVWGVASSKGNITWSANAKDWGNEARARGITVSDVPVVGSVALDTGGTWGHVAVTVSIGDGTVTVLEKNYDYHGSVRTYTYPTSHFQYIYL